MYKYALQIALYVSVLLAVSDVVSLNSALGQTVEVERTGLVYGLGRVDHVSNDSALIDLGDIHLLKVGENVAIIRPTDDYYVPVGVLKIAETYPTYSRAIRSTLIEPQPGDIVLFVREFSQMKTASRHLEDFVRQQIVKTTGNNSYSTERRAEVAVALSNYKAKYVSWERSKKDVIGYLPGVSFGDGRERTLKPLLNQINMMREFHRAGRNSLPAAGEQWVSVMNVLFGPTVTAQHAATQKVVVDDDPAEKPGGLPFRDIQRRVRDALFDRLVEEQNLVAYLVASIMESPPRIQEQWLHQQLLQSQFPEVASDTALIERLTKVLKDLLTE